MRKLLICIIVIMFFGLLSFVPGQHGDPAIRARNTLPEEWINISNPVNKMLVSISTPGKSMDIHKKTWLIFFALPNGNSVEWTKGKKMAPGDDWHYDIQHIAAQTRFLRRAVKDHNIITVYMANQLKSWPSWKKQAVNGSAEIKRVVDSITGIFADYHPEITLNSHSGGGSFIFSYLDAVKIIPEQVSRIAFIDSDYGYEDSIHTNKLAAWLQNSKHHFLNVLAYNDSVVIYNGKPLVSPTGGTWYRTKWMQQNLAKTFSFHRTTDTGFIHYTALQKRIDIILKENPERKIYHTEQVARNGFIHTILSGTRYEKKAGYTYWGERAYTDFIQ